MTHQIALTIEDEYAQGKVTCSAAAGASCRLTCPDGCESWDPTDHEHGMVDAGECLLVAFIDNDGASVWELYDGEPGPLHSGPVDLTYQGEGEGVTWSYPPAETPAPWQQPTAGLDHPSVVAKFRYPVLASEGMKLTELCERMYGKGLVIRTTDFDSHIWMNIALAEVAAAL